ncbi:MAG: formylglycine-generating enzyme family protein [Deltaproteobacteria bacterium]|nr:MAG: formylglycine-generating enzyme family protein [Deltaproteobacteria bacterium]
MRNIVYVVFSYFIVSIGFLVSGEMIRVPDGLYHPLTIGNDLDFEYVKSFEIDQYPVTVFEYLRFLKENPHWVRSQASPIYVGFSYLKNWKSDFDPGEKVELQAPVSQVSWFAAKYFCHYYGKRLPTLAEWEYIAAEPMPSIKKILTFYIKQDLHASTKVGFSYKNRNGIYGLHGLVFEWVFDYDSDVYLGDGRESSEAEKVESFCGGGAFGVSDLANYPAFIRKSFRNNLYAQYSSTNLGFRCVK